MQNFIQNVRLGVKIKFSLYTTCKIRISATSKRDHFRSEETHTMILGTHGICITVSEICSWKEVPSFSLWSLFLGRELFSYSVMC